MDTRYLKSLIAVVDCGSIARAARLENLTAAAVSQRILALERQLGLELLVRIGHEAKPSLACLDLLPRARAIVNEVALLAGAKAARGTAASNASARHHLMSPSRRRPRPRRRFTASPNA